MKSFAKTCLGLLAGLTLFALTTNAQTNSSSSSTNTPAKPRSKSYTGTIASVDSAAKTITVTMAKGNSQTIHLTSKTRIKKDGEPATLADAVVGDKVKGYEHKDDSGDWVAGSVNLGETKAKASTPPTTAPPADSK
jgi:Cu/Ag efflux protein CusF